MNMRKSGPAIGMLLISLTIMVGNVLTRHAPATNLATVAAAPTPSNSQADQTLAEDQAKLQNSQLYMSLYERPGMLIAAGKNTTSKGHQGLLTYKVEAIMLPEAATFNLEEKTYTVDKVWRLTITADKPFVTGAMYLSIRIGEASIIARPHRNELTAIIFDKSLLKEGTSIYIDTLIGPPEDALLPETLHLDTSP